MIATAAILQALRQFCSVAGLLLAFGAAAKFAGVSITWLPSGEGLSQLSIAATLAGWQK